MSANEQIMIPASELVHEYVIKSKIEELEKIKAQIHKQSLGEWYVGRLDGKSENVTTIESIDRIIDKHISELKGEQE